MWAFAIRILLCAALVAGSAYGQSNSRGIDAGLRTLRQPYDIEAFGAFRMLILAGDFSPKVVLSEILLKRPTTAVGALSEARGEITIYDGKLVVSYGKQPSGTPMEAEQAALLAMGRAGEWQTISVEHDVAPEDLDLYIGRTAAAHGLSGQGPFPFQVRGTLASYEMHVNAAPTNGPHGMGYPIAITVATKGDSLAGSVAGLFASPDLVGIVSHDGTRTHSHWIAPDGSSTAHLDGWGLRTGASLFLPKP